MNCQNVAVRVCAVVLLLGCAACGESQFEYNQQLDYDVSLRVPTSEPAGADRTLVVADGVEFTLTTMTPDLVKYQGRFKELRIEQLNYTVTNNRLNVPVDAIEVAFAPLGVDDPSDPDAVLFATIDGLDAGANASGDAEIHHENTEAASRYVFDLDFNVAQGTEFQVQAGDAAPSGGLDLHVTLFLTLIADEN